MKTLSVVLMPVDEIVKQAVEALRLGKLVIYPTETAYGLGVDATNTEAVNKLMEFKGGRQNKAVSVAVTGKKMAKEYVKINETAEHLYDEFLPGPVTVVSVSKGKVVPVLESERQTLGIRVPDQILTQAIIQVLGKPITATSANTSAQKTPYSLEDWLKYTSKKKQEMVAVFIDAGHLGSTPPSTVVDTTNFQLEVIRAGAVDLSGGRTLKSMNEEITHRFAGQIVDKYVDMLKTRTVLVALQGELGAGKTEFTKGIGQRLGVKEPVVSPTYQIMNEYDYKCGKLRGKLIHIDAWRLDEEAEIKSLNVEKYLVSGNVIVIEWLEKVRGWITGLEDSIKVVYVSIEGVGAEQRVIRYSEK